MRGGRTNIRAIFALFIAVLAIAVSSTFAAEEALRWKFKVGEKLDYTMVQDMTMSVSGGANPAMNQTMHQEMDMTWDVQGVDDKTGEAVIKQKFDRVKMKMTTPVGGFDYDSKSETPPMGLGAMIAPMYKAMTEGEFEITMTARGEVKDVKVPEQVLTALKNSPGAAQMGDIATPDGFKKMISQGALVLPETSPKKGDSWKTKVAMNNPQAGVQIIETTYRYEGTKQNKGTTFDVIKPELQMRFEKKADGAATPDQPQQPTAQQPVRVDVKDQSSSGEVLFNIKAGRLASTTLNQKVTIESSGGGAATTLKIDQKINVKVTPAGEKKSDDNPASGAEKKK